MPADLSRRAALVGFAALPAAAAASAPDDPQPESLAALVDAHREAHAATVAATRAFAALDTIEAERSGCPLLAEADRRLEDACERELAARIELALHRPASPADARAKAAYLDRFRDAWDMPDLLELLGRLCPVTN